MDEVRLDNCHEPGRLPSVSAAASLLAGLELVGHKANAWPQTKLNPVLQKQLLAGLKNLVTTRHLRCLSSKDIVTVLQMGWWQSFLCSSCWLQYAAFFALSSRNQCRAWTCCSGLVRALEGFYLYFTLST